MLSWKSVTKINGILDIAQKYVETNLDFNAIKRLYTICSGI